MGYVTHDVDGLIAEAYRAAVSVSCGVEPRAVHREAVVDDDVTPFADQRHLSRLVLWSPIGQRAGEAHHAVLVSSQLSLAATRRNVMKAAIFLIHVVHNNDAVTHLRAIVLNAR